MKRLTLPDGALTGAWRIDCDEARRLTLDAAARRNQLTEETVRYFRERAPDLTRIVRGYGDRTTCVAIGAVVDAMSRTGAWFDGLGRDILRADRALLLLAARPAMPEAVRSALDAHRRRLEALRRIAADIVHLEVLARIAGDRARRTACAPRAID